MRVISLASIQFISEGPDSYALLHSPDIPQSSLLIPQGPIGDIHQSCIQLILYRWLQWAQGGFQAIPGSCAFEVHIALKQANSLVSEWMWEAARLSFESVQECWPAGKQKWLTYRASQSTQETHYEVGNGAEVRAVTSDMAAIWEPLGLK
jgi:hypothetical protein